MSSSDRKQPETPLADSRTVTRQLMELLRVSDKKILEQFGTGFAHELNQPLTALLNYLQACMRVVESDRGRTDTDITGMLRKAINEARRADEVITRLRDYVDAAGDYKTRENLNDILRFACQLVRTTSENKDIDTVCELQSDLPPVFVDRLQLLLVLINLLQNSIRALERSIRRNILIRSNRHDDHYIEVTVQDTGPGVDPDILHNYLFSMPQGRQGGMGIGLSLCKSIIEEHGGRIWVEPAPEGGAGFHFTLPVTAGQR